MHFKISTLLFVKNSVEKSGKIALKYYIIFNAIFNAIFDAIFDAIFICPIAIA